MEAKQYIFSDELEKIYLERYAGFWGHSEGNTHKLSYNDLYNIMASIYGEQPDLFGKACVVVAGNIKELGTAGDWLKIEYLYKAD